MRPIIRIVIFGTGSISLHAFGLYWQGVPLWTFTDLALLITAFQCRRRLG